jgi:hypothetical protein
MIFKTIVHLVGFLFIVVIADARNLEPEISLPTFCLLLCLTLQIVKQSILLPQYVAHRTHLTCGSTYVNGHSSFLLLSWDGTRIAGGWNHCTQTTGWLSFTYKSERSLRSSYSTLFTSAPDWSPFLSAGKFLHVMYRFSVSCRITKPSLT